MSLLVLVLLITMTFIEFAYAGKKNKFDAEGNAVEQDTIWTKLP